MEILNKKVLASVQSQVCFKTPTFFLGTELPWDFWHLSLPPGQKQPEKSLIASSPRCSPRRQPGRFLGSRIASSCCRKPLSRPAVLHSGCPSPGSTERASDPSCFPSTILQPWGETSSASPDPHTAQHNSLPLLLHEHGLNWLTHTGSLDLLSQGNAGQGPPRGQPPPTALQCNAVLC